MRGAAAAARCAGRCSALLGRVYPKADWAPRVLPRQDDLRGAGARLGRRPTSTACRSCATTMRRQLFSDAFQRAARRLLRPWRSSTRHAARAGTDDPLALIQYLDLKTYLVGDINTKVDRASMAHSLEVREPLMDHPLVEWLATLPRCAEGARAGRASTCSRRRWSRSCRTRSCTGRRWASRCRWRAGSAARCASACATPYSASGWPTPGCSTARYLQQLVDAHQSGAARLQRAALDAADVRGVPAQAVDAARDAASAMPPQPMAG